jgi:hypothetical protein
MPLSETTECIGTSSQSGLVLSSLTSTILIYATLFYNARYKAVTLQRSQVSKAESLYGDPQHSPMNSIRTILMTRWVFAHRVVLSCSYASSLLLCVFPIVERGAVNGQQGSKHQPIAILHPLRKTTSFEQFTHCVWAAS